MKTLFVLALVLFPLADLQAAWIDLFDGESTAGWTPRGKTEKFAAVDGELHLLAKSNVWVTTEVQMDNFEAELEVFLPEENGFNSGFAFRGQGSKGKPKGYQVEIDRKLPGGIYGIGLGGWLSREKGVLKEDDWNHFRVIARGDRIRTFVNGKPVADIRDEKQKKGFFGVQHHGKGGVVRFRKIRARALEGETSPETSSPPSPNILYIFTDDQSFRTVSCYPGAYNYAHTPNIDRLAATGIRFDQAYTGAKCVPSRAGMLTGRFQYACAEGPEYKWWPTALRKKGYYTGMIGKWHWGKGAEAHQHGTAWDWSVVWDHGQYKAAGGYYYDQKVMMNGGEPQDLGGYSTDRYTEFTIDFIRERAKHPDQPWYHWLAYAGVHGPYTPADRHDGRYADKPRTAVPEDIYGPRPGKPVHMQGGKWKKGPDGQPLYKGKTLDYWAKQQTEAVASIDEGVGRILKALEETGQLKNTIIVFTSDQGYVWGHHGLKGKIWPYSDSIRSPLIVSNPKRFPEGVGCDIPVNGMDLVRTFHALAGAEPDQILHGRDMTPILENPQSEEVAAEWNKTPTMMTYTRNTYTAERMAEKLKEESWSSFQFGDGGLKGSLKGPDPGDNFQPCYFMTLDGRHKYIRYIFPNRIEELYDLKNDPEELTNLAVDPEYEERLSEMRKALIAYLRETGGELFVDHLPEPLVGEEARKAAREAVENPPGSRRTVPKPEIPQDTMVYYNPGKRRVHVEDCPRLPKDLEGYTKMTLAEALKKGLPPCSRCPGSDTPGKGNPPRRKE